MRAEERPNVIVILTDDQGWGDLSHHGNNNLETPNIEKLAEGGASFDRFYVCPVCSPTRAEFLTGKYHARSGVYSTSAGGERMNLGVRTIAEHFKDSGYRTACYGKWHNGTQFPYHPLARGFDEYYGFCSGHWGHYFSPLIDDNGFISRGKGFLPDDLTDHVLSKINEKSDRPFFIYLAFNTPHSPMQVPDRWWKKFENKELSQRNRDPEKEKIQHTRAALAMCENIDWNVGRIIETLKATGQRDNTIVTYFCDNGPNGIRWNGDMKGRKGSTDEGGVRSPLFVNWPAKLPAGQVVKRNAAAIDLYPTLSHLAGVPIPKAAEYDGTDLSQAILGRESEAVDDRVIISQWKQKISAKSGRYRMDQKGNVYDLDNDPGQRTPVDAPAEIQVRLSTAMKKFQSDVLPGYGDDDRPFLVGHLGHRLTQLPIRDAVLEGTIERSNRFPNSSFAKNWTSTKDRIIWNVEVAEAGEFEIELYDTVRAEDAGATIELSFGGNKIQGKVSLGRNPTEVGRAEDRTPRMESYEQEWGKMSLGTLRLEKGPGQLVLKAVDIPGKEVMDLRLMTLTRTESPASQSDR